MLPSRLDIVLVDSAVEAGARQCANLALAACNWLVEDEAELCRSCRLTRTRPSDADAEGLTAFASAETAKRRLVYQLLELGLPIGEELAFDLLSSAGGEQVMTGHDAGLITIDLAESDDAWRERIRTELDEPYRTLLGHFRHESAHYYWPILVAEDDVVARFRELFGDEREDYQEALEHHYEDGPPTDWSERHVSAYATMHPWEDWAETFAHYLHIRDTLQTAGAFRILVRGPEPSLAAAPDEDVGEDSIEAIIGDWLPLTYALNQVNRSMGRGDLYPFTLAPTVIEKLAFVHDRVRSMSGSYERPDHDRDRQG